MTPREVWRGWGDFLFYFFHHEPEQFLFRWQSGAHTQLDICQKKKRKIKEPQSNDIVIIMLTAPIGQKEHLKYLFCLVSKVVNSETSSYEVVVHVVILIFLSFCLQGNKSLFVFQAMMMWWPRLGQAMRWLQFCTEKGRSRETEKEEWAGASGASGKASFLLQCSMALWLSSPPSSTMSSCFTTWRHLCPSTRLIRYPSGWERWVRQHLSCKHFACGVTFTTRISVECM